MDPRTPTGVNYPFETTDFHGMPYRRFGATGLQTSAIGLGTWKFGYPETGDGARTDEATALAIMDRAHALGVTFWDTANRYNNGTGNSERVIGRWFAANPDKRRDIVVATKVYGGMDGATPNHSGLSRLQIVEGVKASLARLGLPWVDVLWFHRFDEVTPVEESLEAVEDLVRQGLVHYLGVSQFSVANLEEYLGAAQKISRRVRVAAVQNRYDPIGGEQFPGVLDFCAAEGLAYVPFSPLAQGLLTDRYLDPAAVGAGDRLVDEGQQVSGRARATVRRVAALAQAWGHSTSELTLAHLLSLPGMGTQIPSSSTVAQLESNASAGRLTLTEAQAEEVSDAFAH